MKIRKVVEETRFSERVKRRGIRAVAREMGMDPALMCRIVNNETTVSQEKARDIVRACNNVPRNLVNYKRYYEKESGEV